MKKRITALVLAASMLLLTACGSDVITKNSGRENALSYEDAKTELESLLKKVDVSTVTNPTMDIYSEQSTEADALADIDTFPIMVHGRGDIDIEIAAATEMSADAPDDWLNVVAERFNKEGYEIDGQSVSVSVRKITSGEVVTYINAGAYEPEVYIPSNYAWGMMLEASGVNIEKIEDRIAGNTAGLLIKQDVYDSFISEYGEATVANVLTASINGNLTFAYTNPYTSSTGLNILTAMLKSFDENDPLSSKASEALLEYQKNSPPVAYTTAVLRSQASKGVINAMVMEEQAYVNTPELRDYVYIPAGIRHDHPVYTFDWDSDKEKQAAQMFVEYCKNDNNQKLATEKGFNLHDDYKSQDPGLNGTQYVSAQKVWKQNKNGGKPIVAVFIADVSGSMDGEPINSLKDSLVKSSVYIGEEHYVGLVSYSSDVTVNLPIQQFDPTQQAYFSGEVKNLTASGGTATYDAVLVAMDMIEKKMDEVPGAKPMIFLLTDGEQNEGYSLNRISGIVGGLQVPVYTIAYNYSGDGDLEKISGINEAAAINANSDDIVNQLRNLFNVNM
ncbi:MAG: substrate-binding domain-containing protein [Lachnospiraceae bacterium]|nr:substrate-binding domain-containing protein [Lachnospiraceae bacterium]